MQVTRWSRKEGSDAIWEDATRGDVSSGWVGEAGSLAPRKPKAQGLQHGLCLLHSLFRIEAIFRRQRIHLLYRHAAHPSTQQYLPAHQSLHHVIHDEQRIQHLAQLNAVRTRTVEARAGIRRVLRRCAASSHRTSISARFKSQASKCRRPVAAHALVY